MIKINKILTKDILANKNINKLFSNVFLSEQNIRCPVLCGDFYIDTHNYFPITNDYYTFPEQFDWQKRSLIFYREAFKKNFIKQKDSCAIISNAYILGTSPGNNFYRNISTFLYRLYFITDKEINLAIHRNTSNSIREFIEYILEIKQIKLGKYIFLDDGFYYCKNSKIPGFINKELTVRFYEYLFPSTSQSSENIYISRRNAKWRKVLNETDYTDHLTKEGFQIIDFETLPIRQQIEKIQKSKKIIAPHGSGLTNLFFSNKKNKVIEITQKDINKEFMEIYLKYKMISNEKESEHLFFGADLVENDLTSYLKTRDRPERQHIGAKNIKKNPYFKNFIVKEKEFKKLVSNFHKR